MGHSVLAVCYRSLIRVYSQTVRKCLVPTGTQIEVGGALTSQLSVGGKIEVILIRGVRGDGGKVVGIGQLHLLGGIITQAEDPNHSMLSSPIQPTQVIGGASGAHLVQQVLGISNLLTLPQEVIHRKKPGGLCKKGEIGQDQHGRALEAHPHRPRGLQGCLP